MVDQTGLARRWQEQGLIVTPSLNWTSETLEYIGYGIPPGSVVADEARPRFKDADFLRAGSLTSTSMFLRPFPRKKRPKNASSKQILKKG